MPKSLCIITGASSGIGAQRKLKISLKKPKSQKIYPNKDTLSFYLEEDLKKWKN
jgi:hypothetical protein